MDDENELKQINEIIDKIDTIPDDEWLKKEEETEEDYNKRIGLIEEKIENELFEYISNSLLVGQDINEDEVLKEVQEKIKNDFELFSEVFTINEDGTVTLKNDEELKLLGYNTPDEIHTLKHIENNKNNPDQYLNEIKDSIHSKNIDMKINTKMELVKSIIEAKKRGEIFPISLNPSWEKDKFEKANEYIYKTNNLKRIPTIQNEYTNNNYIINKRYDDIFKKYSNDNISNPSNSLQAPNIYSTVEKIRTNRIPDGKDVFYTNIIKMLDVNNDYTKQSIKARFELKSLLKEFQNNNSSKEELKKLNAKIEDIKNKYPNILNNKLIEKIANEFNIDLIGNNDLLELTMEDVAMQNVTQDESNVSLIEDRSIFDSRRTEILNVIARFNADDKAVLNIPENYIFYIANYLKSNDDEYVRNSFNNMLCKIEDSLQGNFAKDFIKNDIDFNIILLDYLYQLYSEENEQSVITPNKQKAVDFLHKELDYFAELRNAVYSINDNSINRIKNEAKFSNSLKKLKNSKLSAKIPVMKLVINYELARRGESIENLSKVLNMYKERIETNSPISNIELDQLSTIFYEGINDLSGKTVIEPDKVEAKKVYETLIKDCTDKRVEIYYKRLYELYSDKTLPTFDETKAEELKNIMQQKEIEAKSDDSFNDKKSLSQPKVYVCSDIHGQYSLYEEIIKKLDDNDKLYILGDIIDRGPDGIKILQDMIKRQKSGQIEFVVGNHEIMMLKSLFLDDEREKNNWLQNNGGDVTKQYFDALSKDEQNKIREFILDSYVYKNINVNLQPVHLVHAKAVESANENEDKTVRELLIEGKMKMIEEAVWCRNDLSTYNKDIAKEGTFTIIGHTPSDSKMVEYRDGYLNIDCGATYNGRESLVDLQNGKVEYITIKDTRIKEKEIGM